MARHLTWTLFITCPQSHIAVIVSARRTLLTRSKLKELPASNANAHFMHDFYQKRGYENEELIADLTRYSQ